VLDDDAAGEADAYMLSLAGADACAAELRFTGEAASALSAGVAWPACGPWLRVLAAVLLPPAACA